MDIRHAIHQRRSVRLFQNKAVSPEVLKELVDMARMHASGGNLQPLKYAVVCKQPLLGKVFECFKWAMYLPGFTIEEHQRPTAFILIYADTRIKKEPQFDLGAASTNIMLGAMEYGLATCCLGSADAARLAAVLPMPEHLNFMLAIAIGYPAQESTAVPYNGDHRYYMQENGSICVPKRTPDEVTVFSDESI